MKDGTDETRHVVSAAPSTGIAAQRGNVPAAGGCTGIHAAVQHPPSAGLRGRGTLGYVGTGGLKGDLTALVELHLLRYLFLKKRGWVFFGE